MKNNVLFISFCFNVKYKYLNAVDMPIVYNLINLLTSKHLS